MSGLNDVKIYFGIVDDIVDDEKIFRVRAKIKGYTDKVETRDLPWYYPWFGVNYLPDIGDEIPIIIFNDEFVNGFYTKKADIKKRENLSDDDYKTYLEIYKQDIDKVKLIYEKSKGINFSYDTANLNIDKDKIVNTVGDSKSIFDDNQLDIVINKIRMKLDDSGFHMKKDSETMKKLWNDLLTQIELHQFTNTNGHTLKLENKAAFTDIKNRGNKFFS